MIQGEGPVLGETRRGTSTKSDKERDQYYVRQGEGAVLSMTGEGISTK